MEVCVDCVESAWQAYEGKANRLELCSSLLSGGLTPTPGLLKKVRTLVSIPVHVMLRNREGDFNYSLDELEIMKHDAENLKNVGVDGFVFGALKVDGSVNQEAYDFMFETLKGFPVTFHRAFDMSANLHESLEDIISLGCERVLTSGGKPSAHEGLKQIKELFEKASGRISIMPGGGITVNNLEQILLETGAKEFHASARVEFPSEMLYFNSSVNMSSSNSNEYSRQICSKDVVKNMIDIYNKTKFKFK